MQIKFATSNLDISRCFPVMVQLRSHLTEAEFVNRVQRQQQAGYFLVYVEKNNSIKAVAGCRLMETLIDGQLLYIDDLITDTSERSQGYGSALIDWLIEYAKSQGCGSLQLDSGVQRAAAHRFYFRKGLTISSFRFKRSLQ
ncbi:GNAT family N-acetyltransferase [Chroococcidiopsis sp. CCNUC1]|jgi:GNAT superfamily N-acetyltransferase|uniref:GNAT family N-acetyltransferase n=1 Tax=Chroococcidiopsis sp. CCNUC1 TaxID=2653189 RepID=UPI0020211342|nr:GNAT family N-acetyltransferase [Chroococcidiopsis sp. CCNUC1]URD51767.1 GNAT family N-acetyltransferase [Chroococcidiopsis sp. CCNUC1]